MHMADALLAPAVAGTMYACSGVALGGSIKSIKFQDHQDKIPMMGVMGAFVFATQMINFTIPGTGSSGHLCGGMLLSAILGPGAGFVTMACVLLIQCLLFADGGLMALGANIWNMAFYGCFLGGYVVWRLMMKNGASKRKIMLSSIVGCIISLQLGAFSVSLETLLSDITELPFMAFVSAMQPIHLAIGLVEGLITGTVLCFLFETRPELLYGVSGQREKQSISFRKVFGILAVVTGFVGGLLALFASSHPDGLEWSIERLTGDTEIAQPNNIPDIFSSIQGKLALLADYQLGGKESATGTSLSGVVGALLVFAICIGVCVLIRSVKKKSKYEQN